MEKSNKGSIRLRQLFSPPSSASSITSSSILLAALKILKDLSETLQNVPYLNAVAGISVQIIEIQEQIASNRDLARDLIENVATRSKSLVQALQKVEHLDDHLLEELKQDLHGYGTLLMEIHLALLNLTSSRKNSFRAIITRDITKKNLLDYSRRLSEFDNTFTFSRLASLEVKLGQLLNGSKRSAEPTNPLQTGSRPPPPPTQMFTGREKALKTLDNYFDASSPSVSSKRQRVFVIYGMGGAGKTQIALKFLERASSRFSVAYVINASTVEGLKSSLECIRPNAGGDVSSTLRWLANLREEWFLLFDGVDIQDIDLRQFFPPCSHGNILITTRNPEMRRHAPHSHYHVGSMDPEEAVSLLLISSMCEVVEDSRGAAKKLAAELGYLALAIVQAGSFISESPGLSLDNYLQLYKDNRNELWRHKSVQNTDDYEWTVYTTWEMSFQQLSTAAATFLQLCAYWHHESIPKAIFQNAFLGISDFDPEDFPDGWEDAVQFLDYFRDTKNSWSDLEFQRVVNELSSFSLIQSAHKDSYSIHPLVQSWIRDRDSTNSLRLCSGHLLALSIRSKFEASDYAYRKCLLGHVVEWRSSGQQADLDVGMGSRLALVYQERGWWKEAEKLWQHVVATAEVTNGQVHPQTLTCIVNLASTYRQLGRWDDAESLLLPVYQMRRYMLGNDHPDTLTSMKDLASVYHAQQRLEEAEQFSTFVFETQQSILGESHPATLNTMANLAVILSSQDRWEEAKALELVALEMQTALSGEEHPDTLRSMANLASTYSSLQEWEEAERLGLSVLEKRKRVLGEYHPSTLTSMANLAITYGKMGRWSEAQNLLEVVISKQKEVLGEDHPDTQHSISNLQRAQQKKARPKSMRHRFERLSMRRR